MPIGPQQVLQNAIKAVPAVRYAAGIAGIAAAVAIVASFKLGPAVAVLGVVVMLVLMTALLAFARAAGVGTSKPASSLDARLTEGSISGAGIVMIWVFTLLTCATGIMVFTVTFFGVPKTWQELFGSSVAAAGSLSGNRDSTGIVARVPAADTGNRKAERSASAASAKRGDSGRNDKARENPVLPLKASDHTYFRGSQHVASEVQLSRNGRLDGSATLENDVVLDPFCGHVQVTLLDADGDVLGTSSSPKFCIEGKPPGKAIHRTFPWTDTVTDASALQRIRTLKLAAIEDP